VSWKAAILVIVAVGVHLLVVLSVVLQERSVIWPLHNDTVHRVGAGADFFAVYHAALNMQEGRSPYADDDDGVTPYFYPFRYLPIVPLAAGPLTLLSPRDAYLLWVVVLEGLLGVLAVVLWRRIVPLNLRLATLILLLWSSPYFLEIHMGQFTFAAMALCALFLLVPRGGVFFLASMLLKPMALAALPALVRRRERRSLAAIAVLALVLAAGPYFLVHRQQLGSFIHMNFLMEGGFHAGNYGLVQFMRLVVEDTGTRFLLDKWVLVAGAWRALLLGGTAVAVLLAPTDRLRLGVPLMLMAHYLSFQQVWEHHLSGLLVLGSVILTVPGLSRRTRWAVWACLLLLAVPSPYFFFDMVRDPEVWDPAVHWPRFASYLNVLPKVIPTACLFILVMARLPGPQVSAEEIGRERVPGSLL
jgi:hypothetical protein